MKIVKCINNSNHESLVINKEYEANISGKTVEIKLDDGLLHYFPVNIFDLTKHEKIVNENTILVMDDKKFSYNKEKNIWIEIEC